MKPKRQPSTIDSLHFAPREHSPRKWAWPLTSLFFISALPGGA